MKEWEKLEGEFREIVLRSTKLTYNINYPLGSFFRLYRKLNLKPLFNRKESNQRTRYFARLFVVVLREAKVPMKEESGFVKAYSEGYVPVIKKPTRNAGLYLIKSHPDP